MERLYPLIPTLIAGFVRTNSRTPVTLRLHHWMHLQHPQLLRVDPQGHEDEPHQHDPHGHRRGGLLELVGVHSFQCSHVPAGSGKTLPGRNGNCF